MSFVVSRNYETAWVVRVVTVFLYHLFLFRHFIFAGSLFLSFSGLYGIFTVSSLYVFLFVFPCYLYFYSSLSPFNSAPFLLSSLAGPDLDEEGI